VAAGAAGVEAAGVVAAGAGVDDELSLEAAGVDVLSELADEVLLEPAELAASAALRESVR